jgi:hypothetical protein
MKKTIFFALLVSFLIYSCSKDDESTPVVADFTTAVTGEAPNAQLSITNTSTGATKFHWSFGIGASDTSSDVQNPQALTIDKAGDFTIVLTASNGSESKVVRKVVTINGNSAIKTYTDIAFSLTKNDASIANFFSTNTGLSYKATEVNSSNGPLIDIAFSSMNGIVNYFVSPNDSNENFNIPGATLTKFINYVTTQLSSSDFDNMTSDEKLKTLSIVSDEESFGTSMPCIVLFQNSLGKIGAIKVKSINSEKILTDIKVQKY